MHVLDATEVASAQHRAGIVGLKDVLQNDGDMPSAEVKHLLETLPAFIGDKGRQKLKHGRITRCILLRFNVLDLSSVIYDGFLHGLYY